VRVLFWGTPEFATPALRALIGEGFDVVGVVTQPDRPRARASARPEPSPIKQIALEEGIPVLQPERPRGAEFLEQIRALDPDISVVVAYGHILPRDVIDLPPRGTLNIHASLLPAWRGAAPIQASLRSGDTETGVTIMKMVPALDAGPIILQARTPILEDETAGELQLRLSELGALALIEALALINLDEATETPQDDRSATLAPKYEREHARVDWSRAAQDVSRSVRAFDPRPGAWTTLNGADVRLFGARLLADDAIAIPTSVEPGTVVQIDRGGMVVACGGGRGEPGRPEAVRILEVQPAGKRRMGAAEWGHGRGIHEGDRLGT
jgi:methionyl-tRNA formyltransferase